MKGIRTFGLAGVLAFALTAGCGGSSGPEVSSGGNDAPTEVTTAPVKASKGLSLDSVRNDPCQLVTEAESETIFGRPADPPTKGRAVGTLEASCYYSVETQNLKGSEIASAPSAAVNLMFSPERAKGGMNGRKYMENAKGGVTTEPVAGLGDEAFCAQGDPKFPANQIFARVDDIVLNVTSKDCNLARAFATIALGRL